MTHDTSARARAACDECRPDHGGERWPQATHTIRDTMRPPRHLLPDTAHSASRDVSRLPLCRHPPSPPQHHVLAPACAACPTTSSYRALSLSILLWICTGLPHTPVWGGADSHRHRLGRSTWQRVTSAGRIMEESDGRRRHTPYAIPCDTSTPAARHHSWHLARRLAPAALQVPTLTAAAPRAGSACAACPTTSSDWALSLSIPLRICTGLPHTPVWGYRDVASPRL